MECHGSARKARKGTSRYGRENNFCRTSGITIQDSLNPVALHLQKILCFRFRWLFQTVSDCCPLSLSQSCRKTYLTGFRIEGSTDDIIIPPLIDIARLKSLWLLLDAS